MFSWFKKKPIDPRTWAYPYTGENEEEINRLAKLAKIHELYPDKLYVFWFPQTMNPAHLRMLNDAFQSRQLNALIVTGTKVPQVYEFKDGKLTLETIPDTPLRFGGEFVDES